MKEPVWLPRKLVLALHALAIKEFGGSYGIRDEGLLESALARPRHQIAYGEASLFALAAAYAFGLSKNHAFVDGNKRVAFSVIDVFLQLNGHELAASDVEATVVMQDLAAGSLSEGDLAAWIAVNARPLD
jgi:death-on-curing protein